ncbi:MAG: DeoR/GlpR family DNA-binding transcription regulator [Eubacteriales bacterium]
MSQLERHQQILKYLERKQSATIRELAKEVFASENSIRRDIEVLEQKGYVMHIYGGVMLAHPQNNIVPLDRRDSENSANKDLIAQKAAGIIHNGDTIMMDSSSTVRRIIKYIGSVKNIRIITNNQRLFNEAELIHGQLYCTGGYFNGKNHNFSGSAAEAYIRSVTADIVFFSSQGVSDTGEISDVSEEETSLRRVMLSRAKRRYFLCDSSKFGKSFMFTLCNIAELSGVICDKPEMLDGAI